ncbi:CocE/NonD family hydrolase [Amycolatopsis alkalitolerans]|uniref:CocE/NonD family hydrolase n=1 Tax=Amycolatopsis alkalitolerans TaxID=2547244 RepID=A0A5C4M279_9PSEU|nr:CocE/NonD family hydrolase [Amycolatopsis alkalitolerans]TNC24895.1 CocE/NonD family hydrolase [Amycolatopsis alkalitolerans]
METHVVDRVRVPMRDGARLAALLHRPLGPARPVLLVRTPYAEPISRSLPVLPALEAGFSVLVQDCRGTGGSDGRLRTFENETEDGLDTLAWLRDQPWCDGRIAMFGMSYLGMVQLAVSGHRPEGLLALAPTVTPDDYRDGLVYRQGAFQLGQALAWHLLEAARLGSPVFGPEAAYDTLPLADRPSLTKVLPSWTTWLGMENEPRYWQGISYAPRRAASTVPALHVGGWFDLFLRGTLDNYATMRHGHLIVGPWSHTDRTGVVGEVVYPGGAEQAVRLERQQLTFLTESADGVPSSLPPVQIYVMGSGWRTENEWPLARTDWQNWYLGPGGTLGRALSEAGTAEYVHDPADPVPTVGGAIVMTGGIGHQPGSRDQRVLDSRTDILRFTGPVLDHDVEITGPVTVTLHAATSAADADFTAKLVDVHPDGRAMGVTDGIVRARYRSGMDSPEPVVPGDVYEYTIDVGATSQVFASGHRIRVDIASSNYPCYDRNPGTGTPAGEVTEADFVQATHRVFFGEPYPSAIRLPVIPT